MEYVILILLIINILLYIWILRHFYILSKCIIQGYTNIEHLNKEVIAGLRREQKKEIDRIFKENGYIIDPKQSTQKDDRKRCCHFDGGDGVCYATENDECPNNTFCTAKVDIHGDELGVSDEMQ